MPLILETPQQNYEIAEDDPSPDPYDVRMVELLPVVPFLSCQRFQTTRPRARFLLYRPWAPASPCRTSRTPGALLHSNPSQSADDQAPRPAPAFLVALALTGLRGGARVHARVPMETPGRRRRSPAARAPAVAVRCRVIERPVDSAALERDMVARFDHRPLARSREATPASRGWPTGSRGRS